MPLPVRGGGALKISSKCRPRRTRAEENDRTARVHATGQPLKLTAFASLPRGQCGHLSCRFHDLTTDPRPTRGPVLDLVDATVVYDLDFNRAYHPFCLSTRPRLPFLRARTVSRSRCAPATARRPSASGNRLRFDGVSSTSYRCTCAYQKSRTAGLSLPAREVLLSTCYDDAGVSSDCERGAASLRMNPARSSTRNAVVRTLKGEGSGDMLYPAQRMCRTPSRRPGRSNASGGLNRKLNRRFRKRAEPLFASIVASGERRREAAQTQPDTRLSARAVAGELFRHEDSRWVNRIGQVFRPVWSSSRTPTRFGTARVRPSCRHWRAHTDLIKNPIPSVSGSAHGSGSSLVRLSRALGT